MLLRTAHPEGDVERFHLQCHQTSRADTKARKQKGGKERTGKDRRGQQEFGLARRSTRRQVIAKGTEMTQMSSEERREKEQHHTASSKNRCVKHCTRQARRRPDKTKILQRWIMQCSNHALLQKNSNDRAQDNGLTGDTKTNCTIWHSMYRPACFNAAPSWILTLCIRNTEKCSQGPTPPSLCLSPSHTRWLSKRGERCNIHRHQLTTSAAIVRRGGGGYVFLNPFLSSK